MPHCGLCCVSPSTVVLPRPRSQPQEGAEAWKDTSPQLGGTSGAPVFKTWPRQLIPQPYVKPLAVLSGGRGRFQCANTWYGCQLWFYKKHRRYLLDLLIFFFFLSGKFAVPYLLEYNSPQNIKQIHSVLCRHIITLCVHVMHICSPLAVHLVNVWETPRFKASSVSFVL